MKKFILLALSALLYLNIYSADDPVAAVQGVFNVSPTGGATYSIPIDIPQGIGGMQPTLAVMYNSQSGNGMIGWGCNLSGLSVITRAPATIYYDQTAKGLTYTATANDVFYLDGQRLIFTEGTAGKNDAVYQLESDPLTKIVIMGDYSSTTNPMQFRVQTSNGMTYYYGKTSSGRHTYSEDSQTRINAWHLDYVEDAMGNYMNYTYTNKNDVIYIDKITYGKNKNETNNILNTIIFEYVGRKDKTSVVFDRKKRGDMDQRLTSITCKTNETTYRIYGFYYDEASDKSGTKFSRLTEVTLRNFEGAYLKPLKLNWTYLPAIGQSVNSSSFTNPPSASYADQVYVTGDFNGDGLTDIAGIYSEGANQYAYPYYAKKSGTTVNFAGSGKKISLGTTVANLKGLIAFNMGNLAVDINHDGIDDLIIPHFDNSTKRMGFRIVDGSTGIGAEKGFSDDLACKTIGEKDYPAFDIRDLNNDGRVEIIYLEKGLANNKYECRIIQIGDDLNYVGQANSKKYIPFSFTLPSKPEKMFVQDFDCDGLADILVFYSGGYTIFWNKGNGLTNSFSDSSTNKTVGTNIENAYMIRSGDFNGDGMVDFIMNATDDNNWYFALNTGKGTFSKTLACNIGITDLHILVPDEDKFDCQVIDLDFDGKSDVIITKAMYEKMFPFKFIKTYTYWMRSTGTTLTQVRTPSTSTKPEDALRWRYMQGDFNGDGQPELVNYGYNCYSSTDANVTPTWIIYKNSSYSPTYGKVNSFVDGFGNQTNITYASFTDNTVYTKGTDNIGNSIMNFVAPIHGVKSVATSSGMGGFRTTNYTYKGMKIHLKGKGFLGMTSQTANNITNGIKTETGIRSWESSFCVPSKTYSKTTVDGKTAETIDSLKVVGRGTNQPNPKYSVQPFKKTETDLDGNTTTTTYSFVSDIYYENWRQKSETITYGEVKDSMYIMTEYKEYININLLPLKDYKPQLITRKQKHSDDKSYAFIQKTKITYDSIGRQKQIIEGFGGSLPLTTNYTYDKIGNMVTSKVSGSGITTTTTTLVYDAAKRSVAKTYTSPASTVKTFTYDLWGNVKTEKDETRSTTAPLITTYEYDGLQNLIKTTHPDKRITTISRGWNNYAYRWYYTLTQTTGEPWVKTYYDPLGRVTFTESVGEDGMKIEEETMFDKKGYAISKTTITGNVGTGGVYVYDGRMTSTEEYTYDGRGRLNTITRNVGGNTTYAYNNRRTYVTTNGNTQTKTYDAWGNIKLSKDTVGSVSYLYSSTGSPQSATADGTTVTMTYYDTGKQKTLVDPNAGTITYTYDAAGRIIKQVDGKGNTTTNTYDNVGRIETSILGGVTTTYTYSTASGNNYQRLTKVQTGNNYVEYSYDEYGRILTEKQKVDTEALIQFTYTYDATTGQVKTTTYPGSLTVTNQYDTYGYLKKVLAGTQAIWERTSAVGRLTTAQLGGTLTTTCTRSPLGLLTNLKTEKGTTVLHDMEYVFDRATGNLTSRTGMTDKAELFLYDNIDRLTTVKRGNSAKTVSEIVYHANGNISSKTDMGEYGYGFVVSNKLTKPHAVSSVENIRSILSANPQNITYTAFNKVATIEEEVEAVTHKLSITYGPDLQRWKTVLQKNGADSKITIFARNYEKITEGGITRQLYYIGGGDGLAAVYVKQASQADKIYYAHKDHLSSIVKLTDGNGTEVFKASYDAWGNQTISNNTFAFHRGYTGHEHLKEFKLINMNGRMYNPVLGRFLSPDPYVQMPDFSQNFNRYSYCWNNPLRYTDPSGEFVHLIVGAVVGGVFNVIVNWDNIGSF
ncbi:MAG: FG-GAP-like repeat-containing protein, partial [Prevotella sp.]|nr:FG-GAP-like repeat-containing protein [Prevotella sp.]